MKASVPFRILSLAGGGFRGLFTIKLLSLLEERCGGPLGRRFDLISGTSIGGLLAIALARYIPTRLILEIFERDGPKIFHEPFQARARRALGIGRGYIHAQFQTAALKTSIAELLGNETTLSDLHTCVLIPVFNLSHGKPQEFRSCGTRASLHTRLVDIALATSAAPTYFPIHTIGTELFADGGLYANTPDIVAISEALAEHGCSIEQIEMLSIGTTYSYKEISDVGRLNQGKLGWIKKLGIIDRLLEAQDQQSVFLSDRFLGQRYLRLNRYVEPTVATNLHLANADNNAIRLLKISAEESWQLLLRNKPKLERLDQLLGPQIPPP